MWYGKWSIIIKEVYNKSSILYNYTVMIDIKDIENQIAEQSKDRPEIKHSMAYLLLTELKASMKRWFAIAIVELIIILAMIMGIFWYVSLPVEEYTTVTQETDGDMNTLVGIGDNHGSETDSQDIQETQGGR